MSILPVIRNLLILFSLSLLLLNQVKASDFPSENNPEKHSNISVVNLSRDDVYQELLLLLTVNGQSLEIPSLVLISNEGEYYLLKDDFIKFRLKVPSSSNQIIFHEDIYFSIKLMSYIMKSYNLRQQSLIIEFPSNAFENSELTTLKKTFPQPIQSKPGGFFNYDIVGNRFINSNQSSGFLEQGFFNHSGVGTNTFLMNSGSQSSSLVRLQTTWTMDFPNKVESIRLGDSSNVSGSWGQGQAKQFFGIQYGTNFDTRPDFVRLNEQKGGGLAVMPSTVDVFVNNALVTQHQVQPGPFSISNIPVVSGAGDIQLVVTDALGRQQIISRPIYASQNLLRKGLNSYSTEIGVLRQNFGITSSDYQDIFASGTFRRGLSESLTGEGHFEIKPGQSIAGIGGDYLLNSVMTLSAYGAVSKTQKSKGEMLMLGMQRQEQRWSMSAASQWASDHFYQLGQSRGDPLPAPSLSSSLSLSYSAGVFGYVGLTLIERINRGYENTKLASLSYNVTFGSLMNLTVTALRDVQNSKTTFTAQISIPLSPGVNLSSNYQNFNDGEANRSGNLTAVLQKSLAAGEGYGYQLRSSNQSGDQADVHIQNNVGTYSLGVSENNGNTATRLQASGGMAYLGNEFYFSRRINQSFAVAHVADYPGIHVLTDNQPAGQTDAKGNVFLPRLRAYDKNIISVDPADLPFDAQIESTSIAVTPYFRSGLEISFPIIRSKNATLQLVLSDGTKIPSGTGIKLEGNEKTFTVGLDGELYLTGLNANNRLKAILPTHTCHIDFKFKSTSDPVPFLGSFVCIDEQP